MGNRVNPNSIRCVDQSVNWSKYSFPLDVILQHPTNGIARLFAFHLPAILPKELSQPKHEKRYEFCLGHFPLDENYSHSQIIVFKDNSHAARASKVSETAKKEFRTLISDRSFIILDAQL